MKAPENRMYVSEHGGLQLVIGKSNKKVESLSVIGVKIIQRKYRSDLILLSVDKTITHKNKVTFKD